MIKTFFVSCIAAAVQGMQLTATQSLSAYQELLLAQHEAQDINWEDYDSCKIVSQRNKHDKYWQTLSQDAKKAGKKFDDPSFPKNENGILWVGHEAVEKNDIPEALVKAPQKIHTDVTWERLSNRFPDATLTGSAAIRPQDVTQGGLGDCWFMAASACIAEHPGRLEESFAQDLDVPGGYAINLWTLGTPSTVVVDDFVPIYNGKTLAARLSNDNSLWPMVLEKALAKMYGNYQHVAGGQGYKGIRYFRGAPYTKHQNKFMTVDQIWDTMSEALSAGQLVTAGSKSGPDTKQDPWGVVLGHAYTVAGVKTLSNGERLIKARNPWGHESYRGAYGARSEKWTAKLAAEVPDATNADDGYIYLPVAQFKVSFASFAVNQNAAKMQMDYHMAIEDTSDNKPGNLNNPMIKKIVQMCGANCVYNKYHVVSTAAQKVWISVNTYDPQTMPESCIPPKTLKSTFYPNPHNGASNQRSDRGGNWEMGEYTFTKDSYLDVELFLALGPNQPRDFSVVAWGETGPVYVYREDGAKSQHHFRSTEMNQRWSHKGKKPLTFDPAGLTKLPTPSAPRPSTVVVPDPVVDAPPAKESPVPAFLEYAEPLMAKGQVGGIREKSGYLFSYVGHPKVALKTKWEVHESDWPLNPDWCVMFGAGAPKIDMSTIEHTTANNKVKFYVTTQAGHGFGIIMSKGYKAKPVMKPGKA